MDKKLLTCFVTLYSSCFSNNSFLSAKIRFFYKFLKFNFRFLLKQILSLPISSLNIKFSLLDGIAYPFESRSFNSCLLISYKVIPFITLISSSSAINSNPSNDMDLINNVSFNSPHGVLKGPFSIFTLIDIAVAFFDGMNIK